MIIKFNGIIFSVAIHLHEKTSMKELKICISKRTPFYKKEPLEIARVSKEKLDDLGYEGVAVLFIEKITGLSLFSGKKKNYEIKKYTKTIKTSKHGNMEFEYIRMVNGTGYIVLNNENMSLARLQRKGNLAFGNNAKAIIKCNRSSFSTICTKWWKEHKAQMF
jgi:hypothetical protein